MRILTSINFHERDSACSLKLLYIIVAVPAFIIVLHGRICSAQPTNCNDLNYTMGSVFESNLVTVFESLVQHTSQTGFSTSVQGESPNQIYGLLDCRGDLTADQCKNCSQRATAAIQQSEACGNRIGGTIWMDVCFLRYENYTFFGQLYSYKVFVYATSNVSEPEVFNAAVVKLLSNLSTVAESVPNLFAPGETTDSLSRTIYGQVQCWRDISSDQCKTCLSNTINSILATVPGTPGIQGLTKNCIIRYELFPFLNSIALPPSPAEAPVFGSTVPRPPANALEKSSSKIRLILGVVGGLLLALLVCLFSTGRKLMSAIKLRGYGGRGQVEEHTVISEVRQLIVFKMETLLAATENFHDDNKLGEGGFGPVYKGTTQDGQEIAVKKMSLNSQQGKREFLNEVNLVGKIQHRNLVKLLGYCAAGTERVLVYEYLPNKSLDKILFSRQNREQLNWQKRYKIILGIARGLLYLHQDSLMRIIHRDIKASNILLDEKLNPKIADFGLAKHFAEDQSHVSTRLAGTFGYIAPEYAMQGQLSVKADVYSFGVLLLELISGRKNTDCSLPLEMQILLGWAWRSYERGNTVQMIDPAIIETCDQEQALRCIHVGLLCTQAEASLRPLISEATLMLSSDSAKLPNPTKPAFVSSIFTQITRPTSSGSASSHASASTTSASSLTPVATASNACVSISDLVPR